MSLCSQCIGMMERALEITLEQLKSRSAYGRTLWDLQSIRHEMAGYASELGAAKLLVYHAAARKARGESTRLETSMMKARIPELLKKMADGCIQMHGASGYMHGTDIAYLARRTAVLAGRRRLGGDAGRSRQAAVVTRQREHVT